MILSREKIPFLSSSILRLRRSDALLVFGVALVLRLLWAALTASSYDPDEFVIVSLGRRFAQGAVPYRDFTFFHPPGILALFAVLRPLTDLWWPAARLLMLVIDSLTAVMVWRIGRELYSRRTALVAGLLYAVAPVPLLASVRIGQDPMITALGMAGVLCLLTVRRAGGVFLAGICLGLAIWFKYPAAIFIPVYLLAAPPRRALAALAVAAVTVVVAFAPFAGQLSPLLSDSIGWQSHRPASVLFQRIGVAAVYWLLLNPLVIAALAGRWIAGRNRLRSGSTTISYPPFVVAGCLTGVLFVFSAQVYYHYFMPVAPFAALLAAPGLVHAGRRIRMASIGVVAALAGLWLAAANIAPAESGLGQLSLGDAEATARIIAHRTAPASSILTDQFEYAYFSGRTALGDYFWDMNVTVSARTLERRLPAATAVVATGSGRDSYPPAFVDFLSRHPYPVIHAHGTTVWLTGGRSAIVAVSVRRPHLQDGSQ